MIIPAPVRNDVEIEAAIIALGREPGGGLAVMPGEFTLGHRAPIISAATFPSNSLKLPGVVLRVT
jgi:hypothetical protein